MSFGGGFALLVGRLDLSQQVALGGLVAVAAVIALYRVWVKLLGPVFFYDLVRTARRSRYVWIRFGYALLLSLLLVWFYFLLRVEHYNQPTISIQHMANFAESFFYTFMSVQFVVVVLLTPAYIAGCIADEKDRKTLEFLLATDLKNREIVLSKLASRLLNLTLLVVAGLPILSFLQFVGGVDPDLVLAGFAATALTMLSLAGLSILASVLAKKPRDAIVITYLTAVAYMILSGLSWLLLLPWLGIAGFPSTAGWTSPVTVDDVVRGFNSGNVIAQLYLLSYGVITGSRLNEMLFTAVRNYALFHGALAVICSTLAVLRLRVTALKQAGGGQQAKLPVATRLIGWPPVGQWPVAWKEIFIEPGLRFHWMGRIAIIVLVIASLVPPAAIIGYFVYDWLEVGRGVSFEDLQEPMNIYVRIAGTTVACLTLLAVAVRAAGCVSGERERQTYDSLLTSPLGSDAILFGKWLGCMLSVRWGWLWLGLIYMLGLLTGGVHVLAMPLLIAAWFIFAAFLACLGLWFSCVSRNTLRANLYTLMTAAAVGFGHWLIWGCFLLVLLGFNGAGGIGRSFEKAFEWIAMFQFFGLTPIGNLGFLAFYSGDFRHSYRTKESVQMLVCALSGLFLYAVATGVLWAAVSIKFRSLSHRLPIFKPRIPAKFAARSNDIDDQTIPLAQLVEADAKKPADILDVLPFEEKPGAPR